MSQKTAASIVEEGITSLEKAHEAGTAGYIPTATVDLYEYAGFDPLAALKKLAEVAAFSMDEIKELIFVYLTRGTKVDKIKKKSQAGVAARLEALMKKYSLASVKVEGTSELNLPRLAACFPTICVAIIAHVPNIKRVVTQQDMYGKLQIEYPILLTSSSLLGILPVDEDQYSDPSQIGYLPRIITLYTVFESRTLNSKEVKDKKDSEIFSANMVYTKLAWSSGAVPAGKRLKICGIDDMKSVMKVVGDKLMLSAEVISIYRKMNEKYADCFAIPWN